MWPGPLPAPNPESVLHAKLQAHVRVPPAPVFAAVRGETLGAVDIPKVRMDWKKNDSDRRLRRARQGQGKPFLRRSARTTRLPHPRLGLAIRVGQRRPTQQGTQFFLNINDRLSPLQSLVQAQDFPTQLLKLLLVGVSFSFRPKGLRHQSLPHPRIAFMPPNRQVRRIQPLPPQQGANSASPFTASASFCQRRCKKPHSAGRKFPTP